VVTTDPPHDEQRRGEQAEAAQALVGEQLRSARAEVFRAYLRARERARTLAEEEHHEAGRHGSTAS
jgi:F0F1-type ATP synthase membrane subunit b/b'